MISVKNPCKILVIILLAVTGCDLFNNEHPEIPGKLVYAAPDKNGEYQIYTSLTNGESRRQLTHFDSGSSSPSWSPDGKQIVFTTSFQSPLSSSSIYIMNADGSDKRSLEGEFEGRMTTVAGDNPSWSPDGSKIAYDLCINCELGGGNKELFVYDFESMTIQQITSSLGSDFFSVWNSNENRISFSSDREYFATEDRRLDQDLYDILPDGTGLRRITTDGRTGFWVWNPITKSYLIKRNSNPILWYSLDPITKDTINIPQISSLTQTEMNDFVPLEFSRGGKFLWTIKLHHPVFNFYFLDTDTNELIETLQIENISGFDWYYDEE